EPREPRAHVLPVPGRYWISVIVVRGLFRIEKTQGVGGLPFQHGAEPAVVDLKGAFPRPVRWVPEDEVLPGLTRHRRAPGRSRVLWADEHRRVTPVVQLRQPQGRIRGNAGREYAQEGGVGPHAVPDRHGERELVEAVILGLVHLGNMHCGAALFGGGSEGSPEVVPAWIVRPDDIRVIRPAGDLDGIRVKDIPALEE